MQHRIGSSRNRGAFHKPAFPFRPRVAPGAATLLGLALLVGAAGCRVHWTVAPHPLYSPREVVRLQLEALSRAEEGSGIELAFRFASPENKRATGPLEQFESIVRTPAYEPMLGHLGAEFGELVTIGPVAAQAVRITARDGSRHVYLFELSRQEAGADAGCWLVDSVWPIESEKPPGIAI